MLEKALTGSRLYGSWLTLLLILFGVGIFFYFRQLEYGLGLTGMSRDVSWGLYTSQFTFLDGIAASAAMLTLLCYLHNYEAFRKIVVLGMFLAVGAVVMCMTFVFVNLGQPARVMYVILYGSPTSPLFWDMVVLSVYLLLNIVIGWTLLSADKNGIPPPAWVKPLIYLSIPWAIVMQTVAAFIYSGMPGRSIWLTAIMAPRFLATAFASGLALLILLCFVLRRFGGFDAGKKAIDALASIVTYAFVTSIFFVLIELWTIFYSQVPDCMEHCRFLLAGLQDDNTIAHLMRISFISAAIAFAVLINPRTRKNEFFLAVACILVFFSLWIEKGLGLVVPGFVPSPLGHVTRYVPSGTEVAITIGIWAMGFLIITILYKIFLSVQEAEQL